MSVTFRVIVLVMVSLTAAVYYLFRRWYRSYMSRRWRRKRTEEFRRTFAGEPLSSRERVVRAILGAKADGWLSFTSHLLAENKELIQTLIEQTDTNSLEQLVGLLGQAAIKLRTQIRVTWLLREEFLTAVKLANEFFPNKFTHDPATYLRPDEWGRLKEAIEYYQRLEKNNLPREERRVAPQT